MGVAQGTELIWSAFRVGSEFLASRAVNRAKEFPMPDLVHDLGALIRRTEEDEAAQVLDFVLPKIVPEDDAADELGIRTVQIYHEKPVKKLSQSSFSTLRQSIFQIMPRVCFAVQQRRRIRPKLMQSILVPVRIVSPPQ